LTVSLAALLVSLMLSAWMQAGVTRPIVEIASLARQVVEKRDYSLRARRTTQDEIATLVDAFNGMLSEIEQRTAALESSTREVRRLNEDLENRVRSRTAQLEETNRQLEAFSYSVSHDLRGPLRAIDGFSQALLEDFADHVQDGMRRYLDRIRSATLRMSQLIEDLLSLAQISRAEVSWKDVDLSAMVRQVLTELANRDPERKVDTLIWEGVVVRGDARLLRIALENLLANAWKFTSRLPRAQIEFGVLRDSEATTFFVRDNGVGFDMAHANKLFDAFQRLHAVRDFPGTGVGLATVQRVVHKLGGRLWAYAEPGKGATFYFTIGREEVKAEEREQREERETA
jgi:signal transduction histidine kinase